MCMNALSVLMTYHNAKKLNGVENNFIEPIFFEISIPRFSETPYIY